MKKLPEYPEKELKRWKHIRCCYAGGANLQRWMMADEVIRGPESIMEQAKKREGKA